MLISQKCRENEYLIKDMKTAALRDDKEDGECSVKVFTKTKYRKLTCLAMDGSDYGDAEKVAITSNYLLDKFIRNVSSECSRI